MNTKPSTHLHRHLANPDVSILSLDSLKSCEKLVPGEPKHLTDGLTLSILQSAAEGLLEIDSSTAGRVWIDGKEASEIATIHPGQIVQTTKGRFVMVRHLQSLIVPRDPSQTRPQAYSKAVQLALLSLQTAQANVPMTALAAGSVQLSGMPTLEANKAPPMATSFPSHGPSQISLLDPTASNSQAMPLSKKPQITKKMAVRAVMVIMASIIGYTLLQNPESRLDSKTDSMGQTTVAPRAKATVEESKNPSPVVANKSTIVPVPATAAPDTVSGDVNQKTQPTIQGTPAPQAQSSAGPSAVQALKAAAQPGIRATSSVRKTIPQQVGRRTSTGSQTEAVTPQTSIGLSSKDRQTVLEYKLEAKFDRSNARAKLKKMAEQFPAGSSARREVMQAYEQL
jgi:hypothetical protein